VVMHEDAQKFEVVVPDEMLSLAIGRRGQNVRLASQLTGWEIDILTEEEESDRRQEELRQRSELFMDALVIDEMMAQLLATEGFNSVEEVAFVEQGELATLEGFDEDLAAALQQRAADYLEARDAEFDEQRSELGVTEELAALEGLTPGMLVTLGENGIKELDDFAELATDELVDPGDGLLQEFNLDEETASAMIMAARAHWFEDEDQPEEAASDDDAGAAAADAEESED
ncbi:MAG: helix-hairpin-helix domain-containing protein, partial [Alphaproteobacteria bacterium]|nr:helix-hairpin-helix domain-containing protein [Alphaproteobacteria bacterium]